MHLFIFLINSPGFSIDISFVQAIFNFHLYVVNNDSHVFHLFVYKFLILTLTLPAYCMSAWIPVYTNKFYIFMNPIKSKMLKHLNFLNMKWLKYLSNIKWIIFTSHNFLSSLPIWEHSLPVVLAPHRRTDTTEHKQLY